MPISLHPTTRDRLPKTTTTSMYDWINRNQDLLIDYQVRSKNLVPYIKEALGLLLTNSSIEITRSGEIEVGKNKVNFTPKLIAECTRDMSETIVSTKMLGRWFAKAGSTSSIMATWGITI